MSDINVTMTTAQPINVTMVTSSIVVEMTNPSGNSLIDLVDGPHVYDNNKFLKSTASGWVWVSLPGGGDMLKSIYDADNDGIVDTVNKVDGGEWK
jgi:hypothetical protein